MLIAPCRLVLYLHIYWNLRLFRTCQTIIVNGLRLQPFLWLVASLFNIQHTHACMQTWAYLQLVGGPASNHCRSRLSANPVWERASTVFQKLPIHKKLPLPRNEAVILSSTKSVNPTPTHLIAIPRTAAWLAPWATGCSLCACAVMSLQFRLRSKGCLLLQTARSGRSGTGPPLSFSVSEARICSGSIYDSTLTVLSWRSSLLLFWHNRFIETDKYQQFGNLSPS